MTLFERLRDIVAYEEANPGSTTYDAEAVVWGSLPAVLDCIAALVRCCDETDYCYVCDNHPSHGHAKDCSLAVFVSGQEEPNG